MKTPSIVRPATFSLLPVLALAAVAGTSSLGAATLVVTTLSDSGPGSLRQAIADANPGDTITFGVKGTVSLTSGALVIDKSLAIEGPAPNKQAISGNQADRVFVIAGGAATIAGVTIRDGLADGNSPILPSTGGGILNLASVTLANAVVSGNQALGDLSQSPLGLPGLGQGGGVANFGVLAASDSASIGNLARGADGSSGPFAPGDGGGGALVNWGASQVTGSAFTDNVCQGGSGCSGFFAGCVFGGAIGNFGILSVAASTFSRNQARAGNDNSGFAFSGAIHTEVFAGPASLTVSDRFEHNTAQGGPGGLGGNGGPGLGGGLTSGDGATLTVINTTVAHSRAHGGNGRAGGAGGGGWGGGLMNLLATLRLEGATVTHNLAVGGGPGGQGIGGGVNNYLGVFSFDGSTFITKNQATTRSDNMENVAP